MAYRSLFTRSFWATSAVALVSHAQQLPGLLGVSQFLGPTCSKVDCFEPVLGFLFQLLCIFGHVSSPLEGGTCLMLNFSWAVRVWLSELVLWTSSLWLIWLGFCVRSLLRIKN